MTAAPVLIAPHELPPRLRRWRRAALWVALVGLLVVAQSLLVVFTLRYESARAQEAAEGVAAATVLELKQALRRDQSELHALLWPVRSAQVDWSRHAQQLLRQRREVLRVERRTVRMHVTGALNSPYETPLFKALSRAQLERDAIVACTTAQRQGGLVYSRSYFVPSPGGMGQEVIDLCFPVTHAGRAQGFLVATVSLPRLLEEGVPDDVAREYELSFVEGDGTRLARAGLVRGVGAFRADRLLDMPGLALQLRVDSGRGHPQVIPNVSTALVLGLSIALGTVLVMLGRDGRRRAHAEAALAESLAFRKAMEDSLVTGLRARDLQGRITYVNPAFCDMVGYLPRELIGQTYPPYWPAELVADYLDRQQTRFAASGSSREGFESVFVRRSGEHFPVLIFEAPLVDRHGRQTGWMSAVLDVSQQRHVEEVSRQQQERLQATARLATMGELASLLSHELNQPLAAIASYAAGSLNLLQSAAPLNAGAAGDDTHGLLLNANQRIAEQAGRAGRVIKSVHDFVRRREQAHERVPADQLIDAVLPLVSLQARKSGCRLALDVPHPAPQVVCDRTMVEQVLLNLTRNGIQSMEAHTPVADRELRIVLREADPGAVRFSVLDRGPGVPADVAENLFTPFFTTRSEGMGLGLSLCRTVIEQHGGTLQFHNLTSPLGVCGVEFRFTLPAAPTTPTAPTVSALVPAPVSAPVPTLPPPST